METCSLCDRKLWARGFCAVHYSSERSAGRLDHAPRTRRAWGEGTIHKASGYRIVTASGKQVKEHLLIAERALGRPLPPGAQVHHFNEDRADNTPGNLIVCPDQAYHQLLHLRAEALDACGHADWRRCSFCKEHDDPVNLTFARSGKANTSARVYHLKCRAAYRRDEYAKQRGELEIAQIASAGS